MAKRGQHFTARHERFCQAIAKGGAPAAAYAAAGYHANSGGALRCASRLLNRVDIAARIREIQRVAADRAGLAISKTLKELEKIASSDIRDLVEWRSEATTEEESRDGGDVLVIRHIQSNVIRLRSSDQITDKIAGAIAEIRQGAGGLIRVRMHDKLKALELIGRHLGMFIERRELGKPGEFDALDAAQKREQAIRIARELGLDRALASQDTTSLMSLPPDTTAESSDTSCDELTDSVDEIQSTILDAPTAAPTSMSAMKNFGQSVAQMQDLERLRPVTARSRVR